MQSTLKRPRPSSSRRPRVARPDGRQRSNDRRSEHVLVEYCVYRLYGPRYGNVLGWRVSPPPRPTALDPVTEAAIEWIFRKAGVQRVDGTYGRSSKWYPAEHESRPCCTSIRRPSCAWPHSLKNHVKTSSHVAMRFGIPEAELRRRAAVLRAAIQARNTELEESLKPQEGDTVFKVVRIYRDPLAPDSPGEYRSFHDETVYSLGREMVQEAGPESHSGGYYCFVVEEEAIAHYDRYVTGEERALLLCRVGPGPVRMDGRFFEGKMAVTSLTPLEELGRERIEQTRRASRRGEEGVDADPGG